MAIDYDLIFGEGYDPCVALTALRPAYFKMLSTGGIQKVSFRDRETWFQPGEVKEFGRVIEQLQIDCAAKSGTSGFGHSAITLGGGGRSCRRRS